MRASTRRGTSRSLPTQLSSTKRSSGRRSAALAPAPSTTPSVPTGSETGTIARIEARRPAASCADLLDGLGHGPVGEARPEHHEGRPLAGDGVEELARGGRLLHELGVALQEAHLEPQLAPVEAGDQDAPLGRRQLTTLWRLRRKRKARWKRSGRIVFRPSREGTRS